MCVGLQGAPNESVLEYVPFGATPKTGAKTSKPGELFISAGLSPVISAQVQVRLQSKQR
jgi:hypothetical protein